MVNLFIIFLFATSVFSFKKIYDQALKYNDRVYFKERSNLFLLNTSVVISLYTYFPDSLEIVSRWKMSVFYLLH